MTKFLMILLVFTIFISSQALAAETIVGQEIEGYFYADGKMEKGPGQFENTYYLDGETITRTRVYDLKKKEVIPDNTVYQIQSQLWSHPDNPDKLARLSNAITPQPRVIRAIGQPGTDAIELLVIGEDFIQSCKSTSDYLVISRLKRIK